ncbi:hypothetical protein TNCV_4054941 [Trichonephila clavipes]|nr:hypothetical protein TNCV_4054941 [Trichonephila clavipes]
MSSQDHLDDDLKWKVIEWIEGGMSEVEVARNVNVFEMVIFRDMLAKELVQDFTATNGKTISRSNVYRCLQLRIPFMPDGQWYLQSVALR